MNERGNTLSAILTIAIVALALAVVIANAVLSSNASKVSTAESNLASLEAQVEDAQAESDALQQQLDEQLVQWRDAQGRSAYTGNGAGKVCYLTFTGSVGTSTAEKLTVLDANDAVATWFTYASEEDDSSLDLSVLEQVEAQGSAVGIGGWSYSDIYSSYWGTLDEYFADDFDLAAAALEEALGHEVDICRLPGGSAKIAYYNSTLVGTLPRELLARGYQYIDWNIDSGDADESLEATAIAKNVLSEAETYAQTDSAICVLLHDGEGTDATSEALESIVTGLAELGYAFEALDYDSPGFYQVSIYDESASGSSDDDADASDDAGSEE